MFIQAYNKLLVNGCIIQVDTFVSTISHRGIVWTTHSHNCTIVKFLTLFLDKIPRLKLNYCPSNYIAKDYLEVLKIAGSLPVNVFVPFRSFHVHQSRCQPVFLY